MALRCQPCSGKPAQGHRAGLVQSGAVSRWTTGLGDELGRTHYSASIGPLYTVEAKTLI